MSNSIIMSDVIIKTITDYREAMIDLLNVIKIIHVIIHFHLIQQYNYFHFHLFHTPLNHPYPSHYLYNWIYHFEQILFIHLIIYPIIHSLIQCFHSYHYHWNLNRHLMLCFCVNSSCHFLIHCYYLLINYLNLCLLTIHYYEIKLVLPSIDPNCFLLNLSDHLTEVYLKMIISYPYYYMNFDSLLLLILLLNSIIIDLNCIVEYQFLMKSGLLAPILMILYQLFSHISLTIANNELKLNLFIP